MNAVDIILFIFALGVLFYSGGMMVGTLTWIGRYLKISEYALAFILAAGATSLPELFVGITSALKGAPLLSFGNIVGANMLDLTFALGIAVLISGHLSSDHAIKKEEGLVTLGVILLPLFLILDGSLSRPDGFLLLFVFLGYTSYLLGREKAAPAVNHMPQEENKFSNFLKQLAGFSLGVILLIGSSQLVVGEALELAEFFKLPIFFVGVLIAFGTTLPETIFSIKSVSMQHSSMSLGNVFGSIVLNITLILGAVAIIHPIAITDIKKPMIGILSAAAIMLLIRMVSFGKGFLPRWFGGLLLGLAVVFVAIEGFF